MTTECSGWPISMTAFSDQRRGRAGLHAGAAGHAFGTRGSSRPCPARPWLSKPRPCDRQRECALHFLAGAHAARADDALRRIEGEIRVGLVVLRRWPSRVVLALVAVAHLAQADRARHVLQFAVAVGGAGQAVERMIGDVELHHALAELLQPLGLGVHHHARRDRRRAGGGVPARPSISTRHRRQEPKASSMSVAQSLGIWMPAPSPRA